MIKTPELTNRPAEIKNPDDFKNLVDLLAVFSEATNRLDDLSVDVNQSIIELVDEHKAEYASLQQKLVEAEGALEILARRHPDWFVAKKTIKTPYGSVSLKDNPPKLDAPNAEVSIVLIEAEIKAEEATRPGIVSPKRKLLRQHTELNLEALGQLNDAELAAYRITRTQSDTFGVKAAKLDLGKAVKEAAAKAN
jgi:hypothetical protein